MSIVVPYRRERGEEGGGSSKVKVVTRLLGVDLDRNIASYLVITSVYHTKLIITSIISRYHISRINTYVTELVRSYYLPYPPGKLYTVIKIPTRFLVGSKVVTKLARVITTVITKEL